MKARRTATPAIHSLPDARPEEITDKDSRNEDRSGYMVENKWRGDNMAGCGCGFLQDNEPVARKATTIGRAYRRKMHGLPDRAMQIQTKIGLSVLRPIDPSAGHEAGFRGPMSRWSDRPLIAAFQDV
jgi:hypothetical protein